MPTLIQTQFLKRHIDLSEKMIPVGGPMAGVSVPNNWLKVSRWIGNEPLLVITADGIKAFWEGVREHGRQAVMAQPRLHTHNPDEPPTDGGSAPPMILMAA